jgi:hypothetical protein
VYHNWVTDASPLVNNKVKQKNAAVVNMSSLEPVILVDSAQLPLTSELLSTGEYQMELTCGRHPAKAYVGGPATSTFWTIY